MTHHPSSPAAPTHAGPAAEPSDEGSLALILAVLVTAFFVMSGVVLDLGGALNSRERAADIACQAARAGADALTGGSLRGSPDGFAISTAAAKTAAQRVITLSGTGQVTGRVTVIGDTVSVKVTVTDAAVILSMIGVHDLSQSATASATSIYGGTTQEGG